mmetsp:Transcript_10382/g.13561  ORF Transcript_10382/g.13561 Transcript_10382/m.13561 type:complete len:135 (+) Transcript_10382:562-966(+)
MVSGRLERNQHSLVSVIKQLNRELKLVTMSLVHVFLIGVEYRRLKSDARATPVEDMYLAFSVQSHHKEGPKMNDVLSFSDNESEKVFAIIDTGTSVSISDVKGSLLNMRKDKNVNIMGFNGSKTRSRFSCWYCC